jgi:DNA-binding GntR family transcriptional regulator
MATRRNPTTESAERSASAPAAGLSDAQIHERIVQALMDQRLAPGTRLREDELGGVFGVSRTRVRQVLIRLAGEQLVTLVPNAGARVTEPSAADAREVFAVRRLVEPNLVEGFISRATAAHRQALKSCIVEEEQARAAGQRPTAIRRAGEFHLAIAQHAGNATLERLLRELILRTSLVLMRFGPADHGEARPARAAAAACECRDHRALLAAIQLRDVAAAQALMVAHLTRLEAQLVFEQVPASAPDLARLLAVV